jgi:2-dehydro-3-deoxygalactonokinase
VLSELTNHHGIKETFEAWNKRKNESETRQQFYANIICQQIKKLNTADPLNGTTVIVSGMATSSIGMLELPYKALPFSTDGSDLIFHCIKATDDCPHDIILVSGAKTTNDVLRGEETILVGCDVTNDAQKRLYIFPGTHSKHIIVHHGKAIDFTTFMTGEFFDLLANKSILSASVKMVDSRNGNLKSVAFKEGVLAAINTNLLSSAFKVRTRQLIHETTIAENYNYLSGLLIGYELSIIKESEIELITIVAGETLQHQYRQALQILGLDKKLQVKNADDALVKAHCKLFKQVILHR